MSEKRKRNLLHRSPVEVMCEGTVVHDFTAAHIDPVMGEAATRCNEVCAQRRFFSLSKHSVAAAWLTRRLC